ncbi:MAG: PAS domain S-box protein [Proteobacteria bacterium]|nr:PAS domain S-box protein [Pseudomonadota bacterium]MBU1710904.1 PAS domain S-box protein [Pseudomonadota bacterium]
MKKKILTLFLLLFLLFLLGVGITLRLIFQTTANLNTLITLHKVEIIRQELVINVQEVQANLYTTGTMFGKELDIIAHNVLGLRAGVERCAGCHHDPPVSDNIEELGELTRQYEEALSYFITSTADSDRIERLQTVAADIGDTIIAKSQEMALNANESLRKKTLAASAKVEKTKGILVVTLIFSFLVALAIAVYLIKIITHPLAELIRATRKIRKGELGYTSPFKGSDEFQELIESFNDMSLALKKNHEEILSHMARNQTILQTSIDGFLLFDEVGKILDANPAFCKMMGYSKEKLLRLRVSDIEGFEEKFVSANTLNRIKEKESLVFQVEQKKKTGKNLSFEISATFTEMGEKGYFFCFIRNITERKNIEEELSKIQRLESIGVLAGGVAHDFNNMLTGILGNIDLALLKINSPETVADKLMSAKKAVRIAMNLTLQLLTFSKGGEPIKQTVNIARLLEEATTFILSGLNAKCTFEIPENLYPAKLDRGQISQVVQNIALNAAQAMPDGGIIKVVAENVTLAENEVWPLPEGDYVKTSIIDQGKGISAEHIARIFDPFFTTKITGNGLGLTICHSIIKKHAGHLIVTSEPGVGSSFIFYLPALKKALLPDEESSISQLIPGAGKILLMDDDEEILLVVTSMLKHLGYNAECARDGGETIKMYEDARKSGQPYDAIIMDLTIPGGMGGKEAMNKLLQIDPKVKALVSSGYSNDPIMADYRNHGFSGVIPKPYATGQLSSALHKLLKSTTID